MAYNVYKGEELVATVDEKEYIAEGLEPNAEYSFSVSRVINGKESEKATIKINTKPVNVSGVTVTPKTLQVEVGIPDSTNIVATVQPENATNKNVTYEVDEAEGLSVDASGVLSWTSDTPVGTYTVTVTTVDGGKTDTATLSINEPDVATEPEE